jgi:hypothetical protein
LSEAEKVVWNGEDVLSVELKRCRFSRGSVPLSPVVLGEAMSQRRVFGDL